MISDDSNLSNDMTVAIPNDMVMISNGMTVMVYQ